GGLIGINEDEFDAIREGILDKLSVVIPLIATGAPEDEIYAKWAEITADDMAVADEYLASANLPVADSTAIAAAVNYVERAGPDHADEHRRSRRPAVSSVVAVRCPGPRASRRTPSGPVQRLGAHPRTCVL